MNVHESRQRPCWRERYAVSYEHFRSMITWLGMTEMLWLMYWLLDQPALEGAFLGICAVWALTLLAWTRFSIHLAKRGFFWKYSAWFSNLVGFFSVLLATVLIFGITEAGRVGVLNAAANTSTDALVAIHVLRMTAVGTLIKYWQGQLPLHFVLLGTVPDLLFALSAVVLLVLGTPLDPESASYLWWHLAGIVTFLGAGLSMFFSVPSPIRFLRSVPDTRIVFEYPMILAPNLTVPLFVLAHALALLKLPAAG